MGKKTDLIMISGSDWDRLRQRPEQLALRLARDRKVLFVGPFRKVSLHGRFANLKMMGAVTIYAPPDFREIPVIGKVLSIPFGRLNVSFLISDLRHLIKTLRLNDPVLFTMNPFTERIVGRIGESAAVYDCIDDWLAFSRYPERVWKKEKELVEKCDAVTATSQTLLESKRSIARSIHLVPNAGDFGHFRRTMEDDVSVADELKNLEGPVIGFIGTLDRWVDYNLVSFLAKRNPAWNIIMIGPIHVELASSIQEPNIHILGRRPYDMLPSYLKGMHVCMIPFKLNEITRSVDPIKVYEYLAAGKPVVSTDLPELTRLRDGVRIAYDYADFESHINEALAEGSSLTSVRVDLARKNTWEERARQITTIIDNLLLSKETAIG